jgi:hypothetical protein
LRVAPRCSGLISLKARTARRTTKYSSKRSKHGQPSPLLIFSRRGLGGTARHSRNVTHIRWANRDCTKSKKVIMGNTTTPAIISSRRRIPTATKVTTSESSTKTPLGTWSSPLAVCHRTTSSRRKQQRARPTASGCRSTSSSSTPSAAS